MGLENYQLKHGSRNETPENTESYHKAVKQTKGNLKWSLQFLSPEDIVNLLSQVSSENLKDDFSTSVEKYNRLDNLQRHSLELVKHLSDKKTSILSSCGYDILKIQSISANGILVFSVTLDQNNTMEHSSAQQEFAKDLVSDSTTVNLFSENQDKENLFCPDCYQQQEPEVREQDDFDQLLCPECGSSLLPEELLETSAGIIERQKLEGGDERYE